MKIVHRVTYREADKMRERVHHAGSRTPMGQLGFPRIVGEHIGRTRRRGFGPQCRECGQRLGLGETAIVFWFFPRADNTAGLPPEYQPEGASYHVEAWLHIDACPEARQ